MSCALPCQTMATTMAWLGSKFFVQDKNVQKDRCFCNFNCMATKVSADCLLGGMTVWSLMSERGADHHIRVYGTFFPPPLLLLNVGGRLGCWWCLCSEWLNDLIFRKELCSQSVCLVILPTMLVFVFWMVSYSAKSSAKHMPGRHTHYGCVCVLNDLFRYW